ncbi:uncharacterized protein BO88DRAFT_424668 [Aspergillus vadensis CBS 113365]|uniref:Protein kinase domain-containing protein n=1 Tax=Aspergillus vadensis (strain CBS 113365 / IMI 142717 / IBT 24658) TaxID=1448311 RepID=A0A319BCG6_ASPVC|nr:hypothetical protein BO88DRAFT_424668 [Aspergillus vadensis CBS 113365]PYH70445.1 hypothetical protein BO88DRAFT_424668 [Aspergillus vadensis CBS 113365]
MELDLSDIESVEQIKSSTSSCIFRTRWRNRDCILKVYHSVEASQTVPIDREVDIHRCESQAHLRLKANGLCRKGPIPDFYGLITGISPEKWLSYLNEFLDDNLLPNAFLIEYIPTLRVNKLHKILAEIHQAGVYHADPYPRNMMVQEGSDRVLWLNFDRAQPFSYDSITARQQHWLEGERRIDGLVPDIEEGKIHRT